MVDQLSFRHDIIMKALETEKTDLKNIIAIVGRGGLVNPIESGIYEVNDLMKKHLSEAVNGEHASNLGALIARRDQKGPSCRQRHISLTLWLLMNWSR